VNTGVPDQPGVETIVTDEERAAMDVLRSRDDVRATSVAQVPADDGTVRVALVEVSEYVSGPILRNHVWSALGKGCGVDEVLVVADVAEAETTFAGKDTPDGLAAIRFAEPSDEIESEIVTLCAECLGVDFVGVQDDLLDLGADSVAIVMLVDELEERYEVLIDIQDLLRIANARGIADLVRGQRNGADRPAPGGAGAGT
jgi:acyl carrier protein